MMRILVGLALVGACHKEPMFNPAKEDSAVLTIKKLASSAFREWSRAHPGSPCPARIDELAPYVEGKVVQDPWGHPYRLYCGASLPAGIDAAIAVASDGSDGQPNTADDVRSW